MKAGHRKNTKGRVIFGFFLSATKNFTKYTLRLKPKIRDKHNEPRADVTEFFTPGERLLRQALDQFEDVEMSGDTYGAIEVLDKPRRSLRLPGRRYCFLTANFARPIS